jgi:hypothetical protein
MANEPDYFDSPALALRNRTLGVPSKRLTSYALLVEALTLGLLVAYFIVAVFIHR